MDWRTNGAIDHRVLHRSYARLLLVGVAQDAVQVLDRLVEMFLHAPIVLPSRSMAELGTRGRGVDGRGVSSWAWVGTATCSMSPGHSRRWTLPTGLGRGPTYSRGTSPSTWSDVGSTSHVGVDTSGSPPGGTGVPGGTHALLPPLPSGARTGSYPHPSPQAHTHKTGASTV